MRRGLVQSHVTTKALLNYSDGLLTLEQVRLTLILFLLEMLLQLEQSFIDLRFALLFDLNVCDTLL